MDRKFFRKHQSDLNQWLNQAVVDGQLKRRKVTLNVTPGGGKSTLPSILAMHLIPQRLVDIICWVTPRQSLSSQGADSFEVEDNEWGSLLRDEFFHCPYRGERKYNQVPILTDSEISGGVRLYSTTYDSITAAWRHNKVGMHEYLFGKYKVALVLDEAHHLGEGIDSPNTEAIATLDSLATFTMVMTGSVERHDGAQIYGFDYGLDTESGRYIPNIDITYTRSQAVGEGAKLPVNFNIINGEWNIKALDDDGNEDEEETIDLAEADDEQRKKVFKHGMDINSEYVEKLITKCCESFIDYRRTRDRNAQMVLVLNRQNDSKHWQRFIQREYKMRVGLAISKNADSASTIKSFRNGNYDCLITVGMAHEGMDAPHVTHMGILRNIRSEPFIEQSIDRATRIDYESCVNNSDQCAHIFVPSDKKLTIIIDEISKAQLTGIQELQERAARQAEETEDDRQKFIATNSALVDLLQAKDTDEIEGEQLALAIQAIQNNPDATLDQVLAVHEKQKKFLEQQRKEQITDSCSESEEKVQTELPDITWEISSALKGIEICSIKNPIIPEPENRKIRKLISTIPEFRFASYDRMLEVLDDPRFAAFT